MTREQSIDNVKRVKENLLKFAIQPSSARVSWTEQAVHEDTWHEDTKNTLLENIKHDILMTVYILLKKEFLHCRSASLGCQQQVL